jgi:Cof subfamily protein (haloacid dehalogenase superfamily)
MRSAPAQSAVSTPPRVIASDLDGTLLRSDGMLSDRTRSALLAVEDLGIEVVFVTARPPRWLAELADAIGGHGHVICLNGACVYEVLTRRVSEVRGFAEPAVRAIIADLRAAVPDVAFGLERPTGPVFDPHFRSVQNPAPSDAPRSPVEGYLDQPVGKLLARLDGDTGQDFLDTVADVVGQRANVAYSGAAGLAEMTAPEVTKASALMRWCATRNVVAQEVWAFGDMPNDLPMLRWAGRSIAVANAHPDVASATTHTTSSNDDDGVARVLETLLAAQ